MANWQRIILLALCSLCVLATVYFGVIFEGQLPDHRWLFGYNDSALHLSAFFLITFLLLPLSKNRFWSVIGIVLVSVVIEAAQFFQPLRSASLSDLLFGFAGIGLGGIAVVLTGKTIKRLGWKLNSDS